MTSRTQHDQDPTPPTLNLWTRTQAAKAMHISPSTLARLSDEGKAPPSLRIGRRRLWAAADIASWLTAQTATAGGQK